MMLSVLISPMGVLSPCRWPGFRVCCMGEPKSGKIGDSLSAVGIFTVVRKYGALIGIDDLDPHDLRRSYGRIMYEATKDIVLVKNLLGHSSVRTTQKYIGLHINLDIAEDVFPIREMKVSGD